MIQSLEIENFRGFKSLRLEALRPVNIIVGPNASGKTSLLEALFLVAGNTPENSLKLKRWRGLTGKFFAIVPGREPWQDIFFDLTKAAISISIMDNEWGKRRLDVSLGSEQMITLPFGESPQQQLAYNPISFIWNIGEKTFEAPLQITKEGLRIGNVPQFSNTSFLTNKGGTQTENADRFSALSKVNRENEIINAMKEMYPFIQNLTVETDPGVGAALFALIKGRDKKIPVPLISDGINKYVSILLAIYFANKGLLLVDDIESGFYYRTIKHMWTGMLKQAKSNETQVFAATHSMECLQALRSSVEKDPDSFCLLRMRRNQENGACEAERFDGKRFAAALEEGFEIR